MTDKRYNYSVSSRLFAKIGVAFFCLMLLLTAYTIIEDLFARDNTRGIFYEVVWILIFSIGIWGSLNWLRKKQGHIVVSNDGITEYCFNERKTFIPWTEVQKVKYGRIYGGIIILSNNNLCVHIMNGIEEYEKIEKELFKQSEAYRNFRDKNLILRWLEKIGIYI